MVGLVDANSSNGNMRRARAGGQHTPKRNTEHIPTQTRDCLNPRWTYGLFMEPSQYQKNGMRRACAIDNGQSICFATFTQKYDAKTCNATRH